MKNILFPGTDDELRGLLRLVEYGEKSGESCSHFLSRILISKENYNRMMREKEEEAERLEEDDFSIEDELDEEEFVALYYFLLDLIEADKENENLRDKYRK